MEIPEINVGQMTICVSCQAGTVAKRALPSLISKRLSMRRSVLVRLPRWLLVALCLCAIASPQPQGTVQSMKLLTPLVGWASTHRRVFWTTDAGVHWKDITPKAGSAEVVASVFFLDTSSGWVLLSDNEPAADLPRFVLASTNSAGAGWSTQNVSIPDLNTETTHHTLKDGCGTLTEARNVSWGGHWWHD